MATANTDIVDQTEIDNKYSCGICRNVVENSSRIGECKHLFCKDCLFNWYNQMKTCPVCLAAFEITNIIPDGSIENDLRELFGKCKFCKKSIRLCEYKAHLVKCSTSPRVFPDLGPLNANKVTNRYTFACPYCEERNLIAEALIFHCNKNHKDADKHVVCPICKAMPWGDPNKKSNDFLAHLNLRHRFEYDRFVDFNLDEDESFNEVIEISKRETTLD